MSKALLYAVLFALSTAVYAANDDDTTQTSNAHAEFVKLDANHDGVIDKQEAKADPALSTDFDDIADDQGKLDEEGYTEWKSSSSNE